MSDSPGSLGVADRLVLSPRPQLPPVLTEVLADLATALTFDAVADAVVRHAAALTGARASALGLVSDTAAELVLVGSRGYDCTSMGPGARLPLDAGLPITEAARTGAPVVRRVPSGGWVAVPLAVRSDVPVGALLVSLTAGSADTDVQLLTTLASYGRQALHRTQGWRDAVRPTARRDEASGTPVLDIATRQESRLPGLGGDLVRCVEASGVTWLVVADACGCDGEAAATADVLDRALPGLLAEAETPTGVLAGLSACLQANRGGRYVTALVLRLVPGPGGTVDVTGVSAGHVLPLVCRRAGTDEGPDAVPAARDDVIGVPLHLGLSGVGDAEPRPFGFSLEPGDSVVAFTDGLVDRVGSSLSEREIGDMLHRAASLAGADAALEVLLDVLTATAGPSRDDVAAVWAQAPLPASDLAAPAAQPRTSLR